MIIARIHFEIFCFFHQLHISSSAIVRGLVGRPLPPAQSARTLGLVPRRAALRTRSGRSSLWRIYLCLFHQPPLKNPLSLPSDLLHPYAPKSTRFDLRHPKFPGRAAFNAAREDLIYRETYCFPYYIIIISLSPGPHGYVATRR